METKDYTLIFLWTTPALRADINKYRLLELKKLHNNIMIADLSPALNPSVNQIVTADRLEHEDFPKIIIETKDEIKRFISSHVENCFYFPMFDDYYEVRYVYQLFSKYHVKFGYMNNLTPDIVKDTSVPQIEIKFNKFTLQHIKTAFYNRITRKLNKSNPAKLYFYANDACKEHYFWCDNCKEGITKVVGLHSMDYDNFLAAEPIDEEYVVFLDTYFPYHPDLVSFDECVISENTARDFYSRMNAIFDEIEKQFGYKVLIAAHPRSNYNDKEYSYKKENIYYGQTAKLAKNAAFFLGNFSTTNVMAAMANKPLVIIADDEFINNEKPRLREACYEQRDFYACEMIRNSADVKNLTLKIDENRYQEIRTKYICADNASTPDLWQKIINYVDAEMEQ